MRRTASTNLLVGQAAIGLAALLWLGHGPAAGQAMEVVLDNGTEKTIIWKDPAAMDKGKAERDPKNTAPLIACVAPSGTRVLVDRIKGSYAWSARVLEGESSGCQGVVGPRDFATPDERRRAQEAQTLAGCTSKAQAWLASRPPGAAKAKKEEVDRALGAGCFDLLNTLVRQADERVAQDRQRAQVARADLSKALSAIEPLRTLQSVTQVGVNYQGYLTRLADAKIGFDQAVRGMGDSQVRDALFEAMRYYQLAGDAWSGKIQGMSPLNYAEGDSCPALRALASVDRRNLSVELGMAEERVVGTIFSCASSKVAEAERIIASTEH
jgi:hypothetical protein